MKTLLKLAIVGLVVYFAYSAFTGISHGIHTYKASVKVEQSQLNNVR